MRFSILLPFAITLGLGVPCGSAQESRPSVTTSEQHIERAVALFEGGDPDAAIVAFSTSVSNHWSRKSAALMLMSWTWLY